MNRLSIGAAIAILFFVAVQPVPAQTKFHSPTPTGPIASTTENSPPAAIGSSIIVSVVNEAGMPLDEQAIVKLYDEATQSVIWGNTEGRSEARFDNVAAGQYEIEASARGYKTTQQELTATSSHEAYRVLMALPRDVSGAVTDIKLGQILAPKPRKEAEKGIAAINAGNLAQARKHLEAAYKLAPTNADVNYLMGVLCERENKTSEAERYLDRAISFDGRHAGALTELGQVLLEKGDTAAAVAVLEPAVSLGARRWRAHELLAQAYFRENQFEKTLQQAKLAENESKGAAIEARLVAAESLARMGRTQEAVEALEAFLRDDPHSEAAPRVREFIAKLQNRPAAERTDRQ